MKIRPVIYGFTRDKKSQHLKVVSSFALGEFDFGSAVKKGMEEEGSRRD